MSLRLGSWYLHQADHEDPTASPILILDDVFAELDATRRSRLARIVSGAEQVLVTCAVEQDLPDELDSARRIVRVEPGRAVVVGDVTAADAERDPESDIDPTEREGSS